jgi:uncharacterized protein YcbK (DUF882 family)
MTDALRRRHFLMSCGAVVMTATPAMAEIPDSSSRTLSFDNLHTGERLDAQYWAEGAYEEGALREIEYLLRDFRTDEVHPIDRRLLDVLYGVRRLMESDAAFAVISGYRSPTTNAALRAANAGVAEHSLHMQGMAIDIRLPGRDLSLLRDAARALRSGGVGYYPASDFVHVDTGRVRQW